MIVALLALQAVCCIGVLYGLWVLRRSGVSNRAFGDALAEFGERLQRIGAHRQVTPTEKLIKYWRMQMNSYPEGTPKHRAYRNQLLACGDIDGSGHQGEESERSGVYVRAAASTTG